MKENKDLRDKYPDELRDKKDREFSPDLENIPKIDERVPEKAGCPTCGNDDIQSAELLEAWKKIEGLEEELGATRTALLKEASAVPTDAHAESVNLKRKAPMDQVVPGSPIDWKYRYEKIKSEYIRTRLEVSGSFGNWDYNTRIRVLEHEISTELGFTV